MRASLFSPLWYRYAQQRPQLRQHIVVQQQHYRDQSWYILVNPSDGNNYRINRTGYQFVGRCDGQKSIQQIWNSLLETQGDDAPTQDEVIRLLTELDQRDLLRYEVVPDIPGLFRRKREKNDRKHRTFINPFAFRLPLFDPTPLLDRMTWLARLIFHPATLIAWGLVVISGMLIAGVYWNELSSQIASRISTPHYLMLAWLSFPCIKALHELSHALAVQHWGGQVHEMGITLFALNPAPYVDASAASGFKQRSQRIMVGAIGIMSELFLAAVALFILFASQPGVVHDLAFVTLFICGISTLAFNGNPLLRFDAYYMLCDALDLPNLGTRSKMYWFHLLQRLMAGGAHTARFPHASGERKWLLIYAPSSFAYTLLIAVAIVLWLGGISIFIGAIAAIFVLTGMIIKPTWNTVQQLRTSISTGESRWRAGVVAIALGFPLVFLLTIMPVPFSTNAQGMVWIPDQSHLRAESEGFIVKIHVRHGDSVSTGQVILTLEDPELQAEKTRLENQLNGLRAHQFNALLQDPSQANAIAQQIERVNAELLHIQARIASLEVRSLTSGTLVMPHQQDLPGTFVKKGTSLGYVLDNDAIRVRVAVPEQDAALVRGALSSVSVRTADDPDHETAAKVIMDIPATTRQLPGVALGDRGGGSYATSPDDKDGLTSMEPLILLDLALPSTILERVGGRVFVRFDHGDLPVAQQLLRRLHQIFLRDLNQSN